VEIAAIDLGICAGYEYAGDASRTAIVLPGAMLGGMPVNAYVVSALVDHGWRVIQVWDDYSVDVAREEWAVSRARAALDYAGEVRLLTAKSITTHAAPLVAERELAAIWLTPLLNRPDCVEALRARKAPALLVGGTGDPTWSPAVAREISPDVLELDGADHGLAAIEHLQPIVDAVAEFSAQL
jgi:hypothetical protein